MAAEPEDHPDVQVFDEIRYIEHLVRTAIARKLPVGLTYPQFEVMNLLSRRGDGITPLDIARALQMTKSGLTNTLHRLCARKLVRVEISEVDWSKASAWTLRTVRPQLEGQGMQREDMGYAVRRFTEQDDHPVFWGYFPAYDWVAFSWLFGGMAELPFRFPQLCLDIKQ